MRRPGSGALIGTLAITLLLAAPAAPFPLEPGKLAVTCRSRDSFPPTSPYVVAVVDARDPLCDPRAVLGDNWPAPMYHNEMPNPTGNPADVWTSTNLGQVFGIAFDDAVPPNIYVTSTSVYHFATGDGRVFRLDGTSGAISVLARLPNSGPALGNIAFDGAHRQLFVTNFEDGRIYRLSLSGSVSEAFDPFLPDVPGPGYAPLGERPWAVGVLGGRVYFSVWSEDAVRPDATRANEIWSVGLDAASGAIAASDLTLEIALPPLPGFSWSNPVSDIAFSVDGRMMVAERSMIADDRPEAHKSRLLEYEGGHLAWAPSSRSFEVGEMEPRTNTAGGVDYDCVARDACNSGPHVWATGDALRFDDPIFWYGIQGLPETGGWIDVSYIIDLDGISDFLTKTGTGDVEAVRDCAVACPSPPSATGVSDGPSCLGESVHLDGAGSAGCGGALEYRWLEGASVLCDWSTRPVCDVTPTASTSYTLEARCLGTAVCVASTSVAVEVLAPPEPSAAGSGGCAGAPLSLDGSASAGCGGALEYRWLEGASVVCDWSPAPGCDVAPTASTVYTLELRCADRRSCAGSTTLPIAVTPAPVPVAVGAGGCEGEPVTLDGSGSAGCGGPLEFRWLVGASVVCDWSPAPGCDVVPAAATLYTLEVRCAGRPECLASSELPVAVKPRPLARLAPLDLLCVGGELELDASGSDSRGCTTGMEYQFREGAALLAPFGPSATFGPLTPAAATIYSVDVRCAGCEASASEPVMLIAPPLAVAGPDVSACLDDPLRLDGSGSTGPGCPAGLLYAWWQGATLLRSPDPDPSWSPPPAAGEGVTIYTLVVSCAGIAGCQASDDVEVDLRDCSLAVSFARYGAVRRDAERIEVSWATSLEEGSLRFRLERAGAEAGPFAAVGFAVAARGSGESYAVIDEGAAGLGLPWYRVVEETPAGRGDATPAFRTRPAESGRTLEGGRQRPKRRTQPR